MDYQIAESLVVLEQDKNRLLNYLPVIYADDPFLDGFLRIIDSFWEPMERQIDQLYCYFDPRLTPPEFLHWLGTWVDLVLDENWPEARRRELIARAVELYRRRGTQTGLADYLEIFTGIRPEIKDDISGKPFHFVVTFKARALEDLDQDRVRRIIEEEKPAHTTFSLQVIPARG